MNEQIERLCKLCKEVDSACINLGAISIGSPIKGEVQLKKEAFFKYFDICERAKEVAKTYDYEYLTNKMIEVFNYLDKK